MTGLNKKSLNTDNQWLLADNKTIEDYRHVANIFLKELWNIDPIFLRDYSKQMPEINNNQQLVEEHYIEPNKFIEDLYTRVCEMTVEIAFETKKDLKMLVNDCVNVVAPRLKDDSQRAILNEFVIRILNSPV